MSKNLILKRCLGYFLTPFYPLSLNRRIILIYHDIGKEQWSVSEDKFVQQMKWLAKYASVVPLVELINNDDLQGLQVAITFDDGYESVHNIALPVMKQQGLPGTVYLNTGMIDETENKLSRTEEGHYQNTKFMNWSQVRNLRESSWNIGSHGVNHSDLTLLDVNQVEFELLQSKIEIEQAVDISCDDFSYTWGHCNELLKEQVQATGYLTAVSGEHGPVLKESDPFAIPRVDIRRDYTLNDFSSVVKGRWDYLRTWQKLRQP